MTELKLDGLSCANCAGKIETALQNNEKLTNVTLSFATKKLFLESELESKSLQEMIQKEINRIENGITVNTLEDEGFEESPFSVSDLTKEHGKTIIGFFLFIGAIVLPLGINYRIPIYLTAYLFIGGDIAWKALKDIFSGKLFDENFLMTLATLGAFAIGEYTEAVAVMLFYKVGEGFQDYAVDHSRKSIKSLLNIKAEYANRIIENKIMQVTPQSLNIDDTIVILAGEKVPVDGIIISGSSSLDTSTLTGESLPRPVDINDEILSGYINIDAPLTVLVTRIFKNSAVSRILNMVESASSKKAHTEQFISKFARYYTPVVVMGALILALLPPMLGMGEFREWISRALIFLVISCPCALVLSVPLGFFGGLGRASKQGILIKGGNYLEALNSIDTFVFDKTGTLTKGNFAVKNITGKETLMLAALLEQSSTHPIARSIVSAYEKEINQEQIQGIKEHSGKGLSGVYQGKQLLAGNDRLMALFSIDYPKEETPGTIVHVAYNENYIGAIHIADEIKESSRELSREIQKRTGMEMIILTGDQKNIAEKVAAELNIEKVYSELMPEDKLQHIESLIGQGKKVLFAGDGINDAPVLARAHIGVAMGGLGSDAAIEAADIVLMTDEPSKILTAQKIARKTRKIVLQNIIFALSVKAFFLILGALGYATMYEAIFADVGVALIAVLNSMRTLRK